MQSGSVSRSVSSSGTPQPQKPGAVFAGSLGQPSEITVTVSTMGPVPVVTVRASTYVPGALKVTVGASAVESENVAAPGPETFDQAAGSGSERTRQVCAEQSGTIELTGVTAPVARSIRASCVKSRFPLSVPAYEP